MQRFSERYAHITTENTECTITLNREQQTAILAAYAYGIREMDAETIAVLDTVMNLLKYELHP